MDFPVLVVKQVFINQGGSTGDMIAYYKLEILKIKNKMNHFQIKNRPYIQAIKDSFNELQNLKNEVKELKEGQNTLVLKIA